MFWLRNKNIYYYVLFKIIKVFVYKPISLYEGHSFNCVTEVLQGALLDLSIFHSFQPVDVFSLDRNSQFLVLKSRL